MRLRSGDTLGPYEISELIGKGGMGEVWKARDTRLDRIVAIKTSNEQFSERVEREARAVAALNHPHICTLHDVGPNYLVMELVEGAPLAGPLPLDEALRVAKQIAAALEAAHEKHITHRDLKPGNILVKPDGSVKVLDFGLAKIAAPARTDRSPEDSPTLTMATTDTGLIVGTAAYMAPEQAKGKAVDKRADIWAFGVVLYELVTGSKPFHGSDVSEILASVIKEQPAFEPVPYPVRRLLKKCLEKDPSKRLRDIGDAWDYLDAPEPAAVTQVQRTPKTPWAVAGVVTLALLAALGWIYATRKPSPQPGLVARFTITPQKGTVLTPTTAGGTQQAVSPDGRYIAYVADDTQEGRARLVLWIRAIDSLAAQRLDNTTGATEPFWSPDSKQIAYFADDKIKRIPVTGGSPVNIADSKVAGRITGRNGPRGGVWFRDRDANDEGVILWADDAGPIQRVSAAGGVVTAITTLSAGETAHAYPQILPDGSKLLFFSRGDKQEGIWAQDLKSGERTFLFPTTKRAVVAGPDLLLFMRDTTLFGQRWNFSSVKPAGEPVAIADNVRIGNNTPRTTVSASLTGTLVFRNGGNTSGIAHRWYSMDGKAGEMIDQPGVGGPVEISPDGRWATAFSDRNLELLDIATGTVAVIATDLANFSVSQWSPDSRRVLFTKADGTYQAVIGTGRTTLLYPGVRPLSGDGYTTGIQHITDWTKDGLVVGGAGKVGLLPAPDETASSPLPFALKVLGEIKGDQFRVSPDGKWVTYSAPSQRAAAFYRDVWIASFPSLTNRRLVSAGTEPKWSADGKLLFGRDSVLYTVDVKPGPLPEFSAPKELLRVQGLQMGGAANVWGWAITPDGKRVLARSLASVATESLEDIYVVLNWPALIK